MMARETLIDFFNDFARLRSGFLTYDDGFRSRSDSYQEVADKSKAFAARLCEAAIGKDDKIIIYGENRPEWVIALWGALLEGVVVVPIDFRASPEFVRKIDAIVEARVILTGDEVEIPPADRVWRLSGLNDAPPARPAPAPLTKGQIAQIIFTSGATAEPKGVIITHKNILANIVPVEREVQKYLKYGRPFFPIRFLNLLPLSHLFGQAMATFIPPMLAGEVVFIRGYTPSEILRQIRARRISVLVCVPQILEILREYLAHRFPELRSVTPDSAHWLIRWWRYRRVHRLFGWKFWSFIVGAAPLAADLEAFFSRLGFLVIQGYGLTETAPIVSLNHPFHAKKGWVGKPIAGVDVKIAGDGEILVRGENVTSGYYRSPEDTGHAFEDGWFHTGDIGQLNENGELRILGRKKEMIVTPEGLNVFPEDVEAVLNRQPGVRDSAVIGTDRVHAVLILEPSADKDEIVRIANRELAGYQKIRSASLWPYQEFPRTEGTRKLKHHEIAKGTPPPEHRAKADWNVPFVDLTSLERVERMVALGLDEEDFSGPADAGLESREPAEFPVWNRTRLARFIRRLVTPTVLLPLTRLFAHIHTEGRENLQGLQPPVIFAANHQSYMDVTVLLSALPPPWRHRVAPAMRKEFFDEHFHGRSFTNSLNYYLSTWLLNTFPIPQREAGAFETLRYMGDLAREKWCVLIFPEGRMTEAGEVARFQPGVGMMGSKLSVPVVPLRIEGLEKVLHKTWKMARPGRVRVAIGKPLHLSGGDYTALAKQVEEAVQRL